MSKVKSSVIHAESFRRFPWLIHGFSTRLGGFSQVYGGKTLNLGFTKDDSKAAVERNRALFVRRLDEKELDVEKIGQWPFITLRQIHSDVIHKVDEAPARQLSGDGLVASAPGLLLGIQTADCLPVMLMDAKHKAVGIFHAGWRGTVKRIVEKGAGEMRRWFSTLPRDIKAVIGPGIHNCCYEVGPEVQAQFEARFAYAKELFRETKESDPIREKYPLLFLTSRAPGHSVLPKKIFLDLVEANRRQLLDAGVAAGNIECSPLCTSCHTDLLFSHRAEKGATGRLMAVVGIRIE